MNGAVEAFEGEFPEGLYVDVRLDLGEDTWRDEDLLVLCLSTEARSKISCRADRAVVEPLLETDCADGGIATGDANPEAECVTPLAPACRENGQRLAHGERHVHRS